MEQVVLNVLNMFGTGKDVDTGDTYLTFLGKKLGQTYDDYEAVIEVAQKFNTVTGNGFGANEKWGIRGSFALGNINQNYNFSQYLDTDVKALERTIFQATQLKKQGKNTAEAVSEAFENVKTTISGTSVELEDFVKTIDLTNTSALTSIKTIVPQFISQMTKAVAVTTVLKGALKGIVGIAANLAVSAVASLAVGALVTVGEKAGEVLHNFKDNTFGKSFEEQKEQIDEMRQALDNTASSIDSYKSKITDLKDSIDSGTLSEQEAYQARKDLLEIQDELIQKYPEEASGIDLLNGSLETQLDLLNGITEAKARAYLSENNDIIQKSYEEMTKRRTYKSTGFDDYLEANSNDMSEIEKIAQKYADKGLAFAQYGSEKNGKARYDIEVTADVSQAKDAIDDFYNDVQKSNLISDDAKEALSSRLSQWSNEAKGIVDEYGDYAKQAAKYEIQLNDTWSKTYSDLTEAQESYNDAVAKNDDKAITAALKKVKAAKDEFANTDIDNSFVQQYMQAQANQLDSATKLQAVHTGLAETFKGAESNYKSLNDYLDITDHKAEQLTDSIHYNLNELKGLDDVDILNIGSLEKAGSASKNYTDEQIASYNRLKGVADQLGVSMDDLIDIFVKIGLVTSDNIKYTNEFTSSALTMATNVSKAVSSVTSILNSQGTGINVDTDAYSELIKDNAEYAAALQYSNGTMQLNREMAQQLTEAKVKESEAYIKVAYSQNQVKYEKVKNDLSYYTDEVRKSIEADADKLKQFDEEKAALESQSQALRDNCRSLQMQYSALMQASSAYQDWINAQNATESGDMYDSAIDAKKALAEGLKNGKIGTVKWQAASEFLMPDDYEGTAAEYIKKLNRYFKQKSDGSDDGSGINNFITDSLKAGLMKQESDGKIKILADKTTEDFAKALKLSPDAVQSIFGEMQEYGWTFDWGSMLGDPITNYKMQIDDIKDQMADLEPDSEAWQVLDARAKELESALDGLYQRSGLDQLADTVQKARDSGVELDENAQQAADALDSAARVQNEIDISKAQEAVKEAEKAFANSGQIADLDNLDAANQKLTELLQKRQQMGEPTDTEIRLYLEEQEVNGKVPSDVIDDMKNAGLIKIETETDDNAAQTITSQYDTMKAHVEEPVTITANATKCITTLNSIIDQLNTIDGSHTVTIKVNQTTVKSSRTKTYAEQRAGAYGGAFAGGRTLVGELGNELVVNPHSGKWYTVGDNGAEFVNLPKDAIVFDHSKTKKLLDQGFIGGRGVALASGTAMDSGSPGMGSYVGGSTGYQVGKDPRVKATYQSTKATKDNTKAVEENKKALEKQKKALEKQKDALEKESNKLKIYGQAAVNEIEKRITALNKEKAAQDKVYESQIKELEKRKTALQKANDEEDRAIKLAELQDALEKAKANRTVRIYNKNEGFVWRADQQAVSDAQNDLDDQKRQWKNDDILQAVDDEIERINNLKDAYDESVEAQIDDLEAMKDKWDEIISLIGTSWDDYQAQLAAAAEFNGMSLDGMGSAADAFKERVIANMKEIGENSDLIDQVTESIEALNEASSGSNGGGSNDDSSASFGADDGSDVDTGLFDDLSEKAKSAKEEIDGLADSYKRLGNWNDSLADQQTELLESISGMTEGTKEYEEANNRLSGMQEMVGNNYIAMADYAEQYREKVLANNDLTWEQKTAMLDAMNEIEASYCTGYDTIEGLIQHYSDNLMNAGELTTEQYQSQLDALISFTDQHSSTYGEIEGILEAHIEAIASDTDISNEARQSQMDSLIAYAEQYGISEESIIGMLADAQNKLIESGATSEEVHATMQETVAAACSAMNSSYQSTIDQVNAMIAVIQRAVEEKKKLGAMSAVKGAAGGINANTVARYATGIIGAATTHIAITDEQGPEIKMRKPSAGNYSLIERGSSVIPAQPSANIWKMGIDPDNFISQHMPQRSIKSVEITQPDAGGVSVSVGDIQMYGVNDVESFGRVIHERVGTIFAQEFSRR